MRTKHNSNPIGDITYLANDVDVPAPIRTAAAIALNALAIAVKTSNDCRTDQIRAAADLDLIKAHTADELTDALMAGKPKSIDKAADKISQLTDKRDRLAGIYSISDRVKTITTTRTAQIIGDHRADLILWCARKRADDLTRCGDILPEQVWRIWRDLNVRWWQHYDHALHLDQWLYNGKLITLPIEWDESWSDVSRASLAWMYGELAAGRYELITQGKEQLIRLTGVVIELPKVPPIKHQPKYRGW